MYGVTGNQFELDHSRDVVEGSEPVEEKRVSLVAAKTSCSDRRRRLGDSGYERFSSGVGSAAYLVSLILVVVNKYVLIYNIVCIYMYIYIYTYVHIYIYIHLYVYFI